MPSIGRCVTSAVVVVVAIILGARDTQPRLRKQRGDAASAGKIIQIAFGKAGSLLRHLDGALAESRRKFNLVAQRRCRSRLRTAERRCDLQKCTATTLCRVHDDGNQPTCKYGMRHARRNARNVPARVGGHPRNHSPK
jgi:hypothetical protein